MEADSDIRLVRLGNHNHPRKRGSESAGRWKDGSNIGHATLESTMIESEKLFEAAAVCETFINRGCEINSQLKRERTFGTLDDGQFQDLREIQTPKDYLDLVNFVSASGYTPRAIALYQELIQFLAKRPDLSCEEVVCALANVLKFEMTTDSPRKMGVRQ